MQHYSLRILRRLSSHVDRFNGAQCPKITRSKGSTRLDVSLPEDGSRAGFRKVMFFYKVLDNVQKKKKETVSVLHACVAVLETGRLTF